ncbi:hypothetical protein PV327_006961 [Microctonus hyperodae]|uniref:Kinesin-like protein KIF13A n=1 Tax=Microctonus hyperodae TaxID=165561 RepID=A0AA39F5C6_MICHY|nr:hypothetical protein PV327_006961 [Microctonus hyperodae]
MATDKIKVAVRVRPFNRRELELGTQCVVEMTKQQTILQHPNIMDKIERNKPKTFAFDHCFYSLEPGVENFASQDVVFDALGRDILDNAFQGYNACIFAYGQTGSGKSYTMMGSGDNKGIIPRLCDNLFDMIAKQQSTELSYKVEVSYMEIYNEKVHDLLDPKPNKQSLKVREHNVLGPYVDGLSQLAVTSYQDIDNLMTEGNKSRTVAATNMNSESSRSHAVFSVILTQTLTDARSGVSGEKVSRMSLVDLAGSERAVKTGAVGDRLKEGSNINKSLTTLGLVISKLADQNSGGKNRDKFVPYRDSVLTWLLKDNLGGNSKTVMVATISPAADNYEETLSTLRYADRAKRIVNHAVVNEDPNARIIRELRQEVEALKEMLLHATGQGSAVGQRRTDITEKISESERLMKEMSQTWEEKLVKTERLQHERQQALEKMGISVQASGIQVEKNKYYLVNLNDDPSLNELLVYYLKERTLVGGRSATTDQDIQLHGLGILPEHCVITIEESGLYMTPLNGARCFVNGSQVVAKTPLLHGDRIVWGNHHFFRKQTKFSVTLQIPPNNLSPNRKSVFFQRGAFVSEPAILVKRTNMGSQVWTMEKLENKLVDMRDMYEERKDPNNSSLPRLPNIKDEIAGKTQDPFYESQENHNLIGVANIFLEVLYHDVRLDYHTPIISQQGEVAGRLQVEISRIKGQFPQDRICEAASESSSSDSTSSEQEEYSGSSHITCRVTIKQASGLPLSLSHFVFCQYNFWGHPEPIVVPPVVNADLPLANCTTSRDSLAFKFDHTKDFTVPVTEEFIEHCSEGALSIEVWGHRSAGFSRSKPGWEVEQQQLAKARSLADRWSELTRKIELWIEIQELNEQGEYSPVEVVMKSDTWTGGIYQLRQGQQRRIQVRVKPVQNSGTLPIICQSILSIAVGSVSVRKRFQIPLDSYQDEDLSILREKWSDALMRRRQYLDQQIQKLINKQNKTEQDIEREQSLVDQWVSLTEERNAVLVPAAGSGIPGAPADWNPPAGMEPHIPVLFLDLNADDLSTHQSGEEVSVTGLNSIIPKEHGNKFFSLPIIRHLEKDVCAIAAWDSSIHDNVYLNRVTDTNERVFLILKTTVRLSHPAPMDLVLRKRLALNIYKRQSFTDRIFKRIARTDCLTQSGVTYEVVSNIPKASEELEDRESLAQIAASGEDSSLCDGETYIEKYTRGVSAVESILTLDRLRQSVAVKELLQAQGQPLMRKTASVPNFSQIMRFDTSMDSLNVTRSESVTDLNSELNGLPHHPRRASVGHVRNDDTLTPPKPFGIASPNMGGKLGPRMTTLHEETSNTGNQPSSPIQDDDEEKSDADYSEYESYQAPAKPIRPLTTSRTLDSLAELQSTKLNTPSMSSSGYGSQAVSTTNLTSDDSISIKSISVDETPDVEYKNIIDTKKPDKMDSSLVEETPEEYLGEINTDIENLSISHNNIVLDKKMINSGASTEQFNSQTDVQLFEHKKIIIDNQIIDKRNDMEISQTSGSGDDSPIEGNSVVHTKLPPGKVVRRRKLSGNSTRTQQNAQHRASFPMVRPHLSESKFATRLEQTLQPNMGEYENGDNNSSERIDDDTSDKNSAFGSRHDLTRIEVPLPDWVVIGESVMVRPHSYCGVIAYIGPTEFASGTWIGVELDAPTGKNDGAVNGHRYFTCRAKCGLFVKFDKLIQDRRGKALRNFTKQEVTPSPPSVMRRSVSRGEGLHALHRSRSRGEGLSTTGLRTMPRGK